MPSNTSVGNISLDLTLNSAMFNRQMSSLQKTTSNMMSKMVKAAGFAYMGKQIYDVAASWMELGSDLQEVQNVVDVTFTTMNDKVNEFAKTTQTLVGINEVSAKKYMGQFGAMSKAFGFTEEQAYNMSEALVKMGGDTASFYNLSSDLAFTKIKSVFTGETETLKDLGIVMTQSALNQHALSKGINKTVNQMSEQEKVALRLNFVMEQLNLAQGDYARTSDGYANTTKNISAIFEAAKTNFGLGFINMTEAMRASVLQVAQAFEVLSVKFLEFTKQFTKGKDVVNSTATVAQIASEMANLGLETEETQKKVDRFVAGFDKLNKVGGGSSKSTKGGATDPNLVNSLLTEAVNYNMGEVKEKTKETNGFLDKMIGKYPNLSKSMTGLWDSLKGIAGISWDYIKIFWDSFLKPVSEYATKNTIPAFLDVIKGVIAVIAAFLKANKSNFEWLLDNILTPLAKILGTVLTAALKILAKLLESVAGWMEKHPKAVEALTIALLSLFGAFKLVKIGAKVIDKFKDLIIIVTLSQKLSGTLGLLGTVFSMLIGKITAIGPAIAAFITSPVGIATLVIGGLVAATILIWKNWDTIKEKAGQALDFCKDKWSKAPTWMQELGSAMFTHLTAPFKGFLDFFSSVIDGIKKLSKSGTASIGDYIKLIFQSIINGIITTMEATINGAINGINGITGLIGSGSGSKQGKIPLVNLPRFANGGTVPGMGSNRGIAAIWGDVPKGHSEYALRDDQLEKFSKRSAMDTATAIESIGGMGSNGQMVINLNIDGEKLDEILVKRSKKGRMTTGKTSFGY